MLGLYKQKYMKKTKMIWEELNMTKQLLPMNLRFFGEPAADNLQDPPVDPVDPKDPEGDKSKDKAPADKKYSDADVDKIINEKFAKWQADSEEKLRQSQLSAEEKEQERIAKLEDLERTVAQRDAVDKSRKMLSDEKLPESFAKFISDTKEDVSQEKFNEFKGLMQSFRESIVNEIMKDKTPAKPKALSKGGGNSWRDNLAKNLGKIGEK
jgi:hypothetical protein